MRRSTQALIGQKVWLVGGSEGIGFELVKNYSILVRS